jgi:GT2 family glycosyltransferase
MKHSSVTILTGTLNPHIPTFNRMLASIKEQKYNGLVEHIILDGGSKNGSIELARQYGCRILVFRNSINEGGNRVYKGILASRGEILLILESDNILVGNDWLSRMIEPFKNPYVFSTYPAYNDYEKGMDILTRYTALIGAPDPTLFYLRKSDKIPMTQILYDKGTILGENNNYYTVKFNSLNLPTMGDNGFMVRKKVLEKVVFKSKTYFHTDAFRMLLDLGYDTYGVTKNPIIHTTKSNIINTVMRRILVKRHFSDDLRGTRKYLVFNWHSTEDWFRLLLYILFSLTLIQPLLFSIKGYKKIPDTAWFLHPVMCFVMVIGYIISEVEYQIKNLSKRLA